MRIAAFILLSSAVDICQRQWFAGERRKRGRIHAGPGGHRRGRRRPVRPWRGDALQCDRSVVIENAETAKRHKRKGRQRRRQLCGPPRRIARRRRASVTALAARPCVDQPLLSRAYFAKVCERLAEKGISAAEAEARIAKSRPGAWRDISRSERSPAVETPSPLRQDRKGFGGGTVRDCAVRVRPANPEPCHGCAAGPGRGQTPVANRRRTFRATGHSAFDGGASLINRTNLTHTRAGGRSRTLGAAPCAGRGCTRNASSAAP